MMKYLLLGAMISLQAQAAPADVVFSAECVKAFVEVQTLAKHPSRQNMTQVKIGDFKFAPTYVRSQQRALAELVLEHLRNNGNVLSPDSRILDIGYGSPGLLESFHRLSSGSKHLKGIDVTAVPHDWKTANLAIDLIQGHVPGGSTPLDRVAAQQVAAGGPYQIIYGVDVFKPKDTFKYGAAFDPTVSNVDYLKWIARNLQGKGTFVMLNDFGAPNVFSQHDVHEAGLKIVKWNEIRNLPSELREPFMEYYGKDYGSMSLTILEKKPGSAAPGY